MTNQKKLYIRNSLFTTGQMFAAGAALTQTYMSTIGLTDRMIGTAVSAMSIVNILTSLLFSKASDMSKNIKKALSIFLLVIAATFLFYPGLSYHQTLSVQASFVVLLCVVFVQSVSMALRNLYEYKLPFLMFDMEKFSHYLTLGGVISGVFGVLFSIVLNILMSNMDYFTVIRAGYFFAFLLTVFTAVTTQRFVLVNEKTFAPNVNKESIKISTIIKRQDFYVLAIPNFLRGITAGVVNMAALIALSSKILDNSGTTYIVTATTIASIGGSLLYSLLSRRRVEDRKMCLLGSVFMLAMVFIGFTGPTGYVVMFFFANLGVIITSFSYPLMVYKIVPYKIIGTYNTLRMILTTSGTATATYLTGHLLGVVPVWSLFIFAYACQLISAIVYLYYFPKLISAKKAEEEKANTYK